MVYVLNKDGTPLMPTGRHDKVRILLKQKKAKVVNRTPFTIRLLYESTKHTQPVTLGVDAGSKMIGLSASTKKQELYAGEEYQQGEQLHFWNIREYVLFRDYHTCQHCKGKSKDPILNVHHIESRKIGGDSPGNLLTLCNTCHSDYHHGKLNLKITRGKSFRDAASMGIMRWAFYHRVKERYPDVSLTYGYITKNARIENNLPKTHYMDAYCIANHLKAKHASTYYSQKKVRCHNRQIHKANMLKGARKKLNQAPYTVKGFRLFDKVKYNGIEGFITGRRQTGYFVIKTLDGTTIHKSAKAKALNLLETRKSYLIERRKAIPLTPKWWEYPCLKIDDI